MGNNIKPEHKTLLDKKRKHAKLVKQIKNSQNPCFIRKSIMPYLYLPEQTVSDEALQTVNW